MFHLSHYSALPLSLTSNGFQDKWFRSFTKSVSVIMTPTDEKTHICMRPWTGSERLKGDRVSA